MWPIRYYRARRIDKFNAQLTEALQQMSNALRAGLTFQQAMEQIGRESMPPLRQEFGLFIKEIKLGVPVEEGLTNMAARVGSEDLELVATSTNIARQLGGNMAEMFETIAATIRERFRLEGKIRSITSQGKHAGLDRLQPPVGIAFFMATYHADLWDPMFVHTIYGYAGADRDPAPGDRRLPLDPPHRQHRRLGTPCNSCRPCSCSWPCS